MTKRQRPALANTNSTFSFASSCISFHAFRFWSFFGWCVRLWTQPIIIRSDSKIASSLAQEENETTAPWSTRAGISNLSHFWTLPINDQRLKNLSPRWVTILHQRHPDILPRKPQSCVSQTMQRRRRSSKTSRSKFCEIWRSGNSETWRVYEDIRGCGDLCLGWVEWIWRE